tara:strand:- start:58 stop:546 length:489 start_codon:yes stop_codon:yes gene_type:complete
MPLAFIGAVIGAAATTAAADKARQEGKAQRGRLRQVFGDVQQNALGLLPEVQNNEIRRLEQQAGRFDLMTDQRVSRFDVAENKIGSTGFSNVGSDIIDPTDAFTGLDLAFQASNQKIAEQKQLETDAIQRTFLDAAKSAAQGGAVLSTDFAQAVQNKYGGVG